MPLLLEAYAGSSKEDSKRSFREALVDAVSSRLTANGEADASVDAQGRYLAILMCKNARDLDLQLITEATYT